MTGAADILKESSGEFGDQGYQVADLVTPKKKPEGGELTLSDKEFNSQTPRSASQSSGSPAISGTGRHPALATDIHVPPAVTRSMQPAISSSSQSHGVSNSAP